MYITSDPWRRHTNLCLQAKTDMTTTDEDVKMEDQILMLYSIVSHLFLFLSSSVMHSMPLLVQVMHLKQ